MARIRFKLYLDTTIPSYVFADDAPARMQITKRFMGLAHSQKYQLFISEVVVREIQATPDMTKRMLLMNQVKHLPMVTMTVEAERLAQLYIREKILPRGSLDDARHVALATLNQADAVVSWNFGHLVNFRRTAGINALHSKEGLPHIEIITPEEVIES